MGYKIKFQVSSTGWIHSGDIAYIDKDGELFIIDRLKELIKYRGHQIFPGEIESVLLMHPSVMEAGVVAVPHDTDDEHPIAYVTKKPGAKVKQRSKFFSNIFRPAFVIVNKTVDRFRFQSSRERLTPYRNLLLRIHIHRLFYSVTDFRIRQIYI